MTAGLRVTGAGLLIAAAAIHLDLYLRGYRSIPVIGGLFLLQVIAGFLAGVTVLITGSRLAAAAGAVFAPATLGGYLLSVWAGLFGLHRGPHHGRDRRRRGRGGRIRGAGCPSRPPAAIRPAVASTCVARPGDGLAGRGRSRRRGGRRRRIRPGLVLLGVGVAGAGPAPAAGPEDDHDQRRDGADQRQGLDPVLVRPGYPGPVGPAPGGCAQYWPPVTGRPAAGPGVTGRLGTITRPDGLGAGHLRRAPAVHLHRRHRPGPGPRQQPQP
jgi:hypothetical protein